jgi:hypothetical protein
VPEQLQCLLLRPEYSLALRCLSVAHIQGKTDPLLTSRVRILNKTFLITPVCESCLLHNNVRSLKTQAFLFVIKRFSLAGVDVS